MLHMSPIRSVYYCLYATLRNPIFFCDKSLRNFSRYVGFSYINNILLSKLRFNGIFPPMGDVSSFLYAINPIVSLSTEKEMSRINTSAIITFVKHTKTFWDRLSVVKFPGYTMCQKYFSKWRLGNNGAISITHNYFFPFPATFLFNKRSKESFFKRSEFSSFINICHGAIIQ